MRRLAWLVAALVAVASGARAEVPALADLPFFDAAGAASVVRVDLAVPGGAPMPFAIDTGSSESFATPLAARAIGLNVRRNKQTPYRRETRLGRDLEVLVDTRRGDTAVARDGEWAIVGARFLAAFVLELDFPGRRVRFFDPQRSPVPERAACEREQVLPFDLSSNRPVLSIEVGGARVPAILTTSAPGTLLLAGGFAQEAGLVPDAEATKDLPPTSGLRAATAPKVRIGSLESTDVPVLVTEQGADGAGPRSAARLGLALLEGSVLRIDWTHRRLWIARSGDRCGTGAQADGGPRQ